MKKIHVAFVGLRGFPGVQGGVETHAEHLCPLLAELGCDVVVLARKGYQNQGIDCWRGVRFKTLWSPKSKALETIFHTFFGVLYAGFISRPDILHIQAIGPAVLTPLARLLGLKVVVTHHGPDYNRQKWGTFARLTLRLGELFGMRYGHERIVISSVISQLILRKHHCKSVLIPNGVELPDMPASTGILDNFGLRPRKYILLVSRLVPEKRHLDLIEAFNAANLSEWKLAIVGASDHPDEYTRQVLHAAKETPNVICTGFQSGLFLRELYAHAGFFVLPSSHEGLPIAMLEALSYGLPVLASDIPANLEVGLGDEHYFPLGSKVELTRKLIRFANLPFDEVDIIHRQNWVMSKYNWEEIAKQTYAVYTDILKR